MNFLNYFNTSLLIGGIVGVLSASLIFFTNRKPLENKIWFWLNILTAIWSFGYFTMITTDDLNIAWYSNWILHGAAIFIPSFYLWFVAALSKDASAHKKVIYFAFLISIILFIFNPSKLFVDDVIPKYIFNYVCNAGPLYIYFTIHFFSWVIFAQYLLFKKLFVSSGLYAQQLKYVLLSTSLGFPGGASVFFLTFNINIPPYILILFSIYPIFITYAIVKYRLMSGRLILTRSILYFLLVALVTSFFTFFTLFTTEYFPVTKTSNVWLTLLASFVIVIGIDPLKKYLSKVTDDIFYKGKIDYDQIMKDMSMIIAREIDMDILLVKIRAGLIEKLKVKKAEIFVDIDGFYKLGVKQLEPYDLNRDLLELIKSNSDLIILEEYRRKTSELPKSAVRDRAEALITAMEQLDWQLIAPVIVDGEINAIIALDYKLSGDVYSNEDINFLNILSPQIAVALEKSKLYEEIGRFNRELRERIEKATAKLKAANIDLADRNKFLTNTQNISNLISRTLDINNIIQIIANSIETELGYIGGILSFVDEKREFLYPAAITKSETAKKALALLPQSVTDYKANIKRDHNLGIEVLKKGSTVTSDSFSNFFTPPIEQAVADNIQKAIKIVSVVGVPIYSENMIIGVIHYLLSTPKDKISQLDYEMMQNLADHVGIVYRNVKLYKVLEGTNAQLQEANIHLKQLDTAKSEFLSIASHQLRTPTSAIKGYLSMLLEGDYGAIKSNQRQVITNVYESAARLARLINIFLNVSRIEAGHFKLSKSDTNMNDLIESVVIELKQQAALKKLKLDVHLTKEPVVINVDSDKIREVVLNLIDNAIKYTQKGKIEIHSKVVGQEYHFWTKDTGMGIRIEEVNSLFRKFVRGTGVAQVNTGGSGLGLYIAQRVIKEHGGKIWAESDGLNKGSIFKFTVPITSAPLDIKSEELNK